MRDEAEAVHIAVTQTMSVELMATVEAAVGELPVIKGFHGRESPPGMMSLAYIGPKPEAVQFELCVMLAQGAAMSACEAGYSYGTSDFTEELRRLIVDIGFPCTEAVGRELVYYWPTVEFVEGQDA